MAPETPPESAEVAAPLSLSSRARTAVCWLYDAVCAQWFILGMGVFIGIASAAPEVRERFPRATLSHPRASQVAKTGGYLRAEYSIKYGAVRGLRARREAARAGVPTAVAQPGVSHLPLLRRRLEDQGPTQRRICVASAPGACPGGR